MLKKKKKINIKNSAYSNKTNKKNKKKINPNTIIISPTILLTHPILHYFIGDTRLTLCKRFVDESGGITQLKGNKHILEKYKQFARIEFIRGNMPTCTICKNKLKIIRQRAKKNNFSS